MTRLYSDAFGHLDARTAHDWVRSVANVLYWNEDSLWFGKGTVEVGDPSWMEWRSGNTVERFMEKAREWVPEDVYKIYEENLT